MKDKIKDDDNESDNSSSNGNLNKREDKNKKLRKIKIERKHKKKKKKDKNRFNSNVLYKIIGVFINTIACIEAVIKTCSFVNKIITKIRKNKTEKIKVKCLHPIKLNEKHTLNECKIKSVEYSGTTIDGLFSVPKNAVTLDKFENIRTEYNIDMSRKIDRKELDKLAKDLVDEKVIKNENKATKKGTNDTKIGKKASGQINKKMDKHKMLSEILYLKKKKQRLNSAEHRISDNKIESAWHHLSNSTQLCIKY